MKKLRTVLGYAILIAGMTYALLAIVVVPASACTPAECDLLESDMSELCASVYPESCIYGAMMAYCDSGGYRINCLVCDRIISSTCGSGD
jgi:hypothetical protein